MFLRSLPGSPGLHDMGPTDVCRFLVWYDSKGKTQIHCQVCPNVGKHGIFSCGCPKGIAATTLSVLVCTLTNILEFAGRGKYWDEYSNTGNPVLSSCVREYMKSVKVEQAKARILPKQSKPLFIRKIRLIVSYIYTKLRNGDTFLSLREKFTLVRDQALIKLQFFADDRASDMSNLLVQDLKRLPDGTGYAICHTFGKSLRGGDGKNNGFVIKRCSEGRVCPVEGVELYINKCKEWGVDLTAGYLFRPVTENGVVLTEALSYSAIYERLKLYLQLCGIDEGETPHSLRAGCAVTLATLGVVDRTQLKGHMGWASDNMVDYYSRATRLYDSDVVASALASSVTSDQAEKGYAQLGDLS
ncbi:integrase/recombinase xerD homolog [Argopecten irradians]|uniref:integrase/recombinase xerD homolog n=1 Tax=Argopecten irradians TaxID=31199 RepID=UPI00371A7964